MFGSCMKYWIVVRRCARILCVSGRESPLCQSVSSLGGVASTTGCRAVQEVRALLKFLHSLNTVLWWGDVPELKESAPRGARVPKRCLYWWASTCCIISCVSMFERACGRAVSFYFRSWAAMVARSAGWLWRYQRLTQLQADSLSMYSYSASPSALRHSRQGSIAYLLCIQSFQSVGCVAIPNKRTR